MTSVKDITREQEAGKQEEYLCDSCEKVYKTNGGFVRHKARQHFPEELAATVEIDKPG